MPEMQLKLSGWKAIIVCAAVIGLVIVRLMTFNDATQDADLMRELKFQLMTEYFPDDVDRLKAAHASGDEEELEYLAQSITTTELTILSAQKSAPLLSFSTKEKVVVKVTYSLDDAYGNRRTGTHYYTLDHGKLGNVWHYRHESSAAGYYLNFM